MNFYFALTSTYITFPFRSFLKLVERRAGSKKAPSENQPGNGTSIGGNKAAVWQEVEADSAFIHYSGHKLYRKYISGH